MNCRYYLFERTKATEMRLCIECRIYIDTKMFYTCCVVLRLCKFFSARVLVFETKFNRMLNLDLKMNFIEWFNGQKFEKKKIGKFLSQKNIKFFKKFKSKQNLFKKWLILFKIHKFPIFQEKVYKFSFTLLLHKNSSLYVCFVLLWATKKLPWSLLQKM